MSGIILHPDTARDLEQLGIIHESDYRFYPDGMIPCGSRWYRDHAEAERVMATLKPTRGPGWILNSYYCYNCDGYHVGHTREKWKAKKR
jgi:hypothetical protein